MQVAIQAAFGGVRVDGCALRPLSIRAYPCGSEEGQLPCLLRNEVSNAVLVGVLRLLPQDIGHDACVRDRSTQGCPPLELGMLIPDTVVEQEFLGLSLQGDPHVAAHGEGMTEQG